LRRRSTLFKEEKVPMTRSILAAAAAAIALSAATLSAPRPADAAPYWPWCSQYGPRSNAHACAFASWEQCMQTVSGIGGYCYENREPPPATARPRPVRQRRYYRAG
jgi:hypothetical protein